MSSVLRSPYQVTNPKFFINVSSAVNAIFSLDSNGAASRLTIANTYWSSIVALQDMSTSGRVILRDMGKTVFPGNKVSTVYRKVQVVMPGGAAGSGIVGASGATPSGTDYGTGYIELGWFDGASEGVTQVGSRTVWARTG
jgi:hypothetical protein